MANAASAKPNEQEQDLSMEEILQSIRRIIAEEGDEATPADAEPAKTESNLGSDVLELTEMVNEDGSVESLNAEEPAPATNHPPSNDVLAFIDQAIGNQSEVTQSTPVAQELPQEIHIEEPAAIIEERPVMDEEESLLSQQAAVAAAAALKKIAQPTAASKPAPTPIPFRSGYTVEDLVLESLKPLLKEWLDSNLAPLVERIVEREIRKLHD